MKRLAAILSSITLSQPAIAAEPVYLICTVIVESSTNSIRLTLDEPNGIVTALAEGGKIKNTQPASKLHWFNLVTATQSILLAARPWSSDAL